MICAITKNLPLFRKNMVVHLQTARICKGESLSRVSVSSVISQTNAIPLTHSLSAKVENTQGPVCFPKTASTPVPSSPSRFANPQDVKPHIGADPASSSLAASTNGSSDTGKPLSSSSGGSNGNNLALDPSLDLSRPAPRAGQPSFLKNTGDGIIRTPGPGQMVSPKEAFLDYEDILKRGRQPQMQGSPQQQNQQHFQRQPQQQGSPMQQSQQFKLPSQSRGGDIQVPQMNLPQMPPPQQPQQNSFQAQPEQPPPPGQSYDGPDAQLLAALGGQRAMSHQGSPPNRGQQLPNTQQHQQQQRGIHQMGNQGSPQQRPLQTQPAPQPMTQQQQNAARQAAYQGFMAQPPPPPPIGQNTSTDIQVPQSNAPTSNVGTPSAGQSSLPPLPNYQSAPAPLAFNDGSFFSHQAILASLQAEENAKAAAAAAAVMGFQNGNWNGGNGQQPGQQQQNGTQGQYNFAQPGQQQVQQGLPGFGAPAPAGASVLGDFSFEQHFGAPPPAGTSPDASTSSRKRIKGKSGSRGTLSRSNSTTSNSGGGRNKAMAAEARALQGQYGGAFNFGTFAGNNNNGIGSGAGGNGGNNEVDAEGEDEEDSKPQYNSRGMPKRKSASAARELAQAQQQDHNEEYEYQGFIPKGSGTAGGVMPTTGVPPSANLGAGGSGAAGDNDTDDSDDDDGDEWVAEESDDSYGRKKKGTNKRGRKSGGKASLTPAEAEALRAASPTTAAAALAAAAAGNGSFDFSNLLGDYSVGSPDSASGTPGPSGKKRKHNAAPPGSGNISCDYVDPKTGERCPVKFRRPYDQARHMETVHSGTAEKAKWACITCKKSFSRKDALIRHGRISNHATM